MTRPPWHLISWAFPHVAAQVDRSPLGVAAHDQAVAGVRDDFDHLALAVTDEQTLYTVLAGYRYLIHLAGVCVTCGAITATEGEGVGKMIGTVTAALLPYVPEDVT